MKTAFLRILAVLLFATPTLAMKIFVRTLGGKTIILEVEPANSIREIKEKIQEEIGYPAEQQLLIGRGLALDDERTPSDYSLLGNSILQVTLNVRGD